MDTKFYLTTLGKILKVNGTLHFYTWPSLSFIFKILLTVIRKIHSTSRIKKITFIFVGVGLKCTRLTSFVLI
jgi:hypothetical protein